MLQYTIVLKGENMGVDEEKDGVAVQVQQLHLLHSEAKPLVMWSGYRVVWS